MLKRFLRNPANALVFTAMFSVLIFSAIFALFTTIYLNVAVPYEGEILEKQHVPAHTEMGSTIMSTGKYTFTVPKTVYVEPVFKLRVRGRTRNSQEKECWIEVSEEYYNAVAVGDAYQQPLK